MRTPFSRDNILADAEKQLLVADLVDPAAVERLPHPAWCEYLGGRIRCVQVAPFEGSAATKLRIAAFSAADRDDPATGARAVRHDEE